MFPPLKIKKKTCKKTFSAPGNSAPLGNSIERLCGKSAPNHEDCSLNSIVQRRSTQVSSDEQHVEVHKHSFGPYTMCPRLS